MVIFFEIIYQIEKVQLNFNTKTRALFFKKKNGVLFKIKYKKDILKNLLDLKIKIIKFFETQV